VRTPKAGFCLEPPTIIFTGLTPRPQPAAGRASARSIAEIVHSGVLGAVRVGSAARVNSSGESVKPNPSVAPSLGRVAD